MSDVDHRGLGLIFTLRNRGKCTCSWNAYVRTAYPELTAIGFAPGVLWSLDRVLSTRRPIFVCTLAVTTALLLISHLPTAVIIAPVATASLVGSWIVHRRPADAVGLAITGALMGEPGSGYMHVRVPVGVHAVDAVFGNSHVRTIANVATVIGCLAFAYGDLRDRSRARPA